ncbi:hypothetical protein [uncultured Mediterranean phage uvMED]|nr:hypothetical protein [uncultured Mediterranean phage uvMED]
MADVVKRNNKVAIKAETTEGTYVFPNAATDFIQAQVDGLEYSQNKEFSDRDLLGVGVGSGVPRGGETNPSASLSVEFKPNDTAGTKAAWMELMKNSLGGERVQANSSTAASGTHSQAYTNKIILLSDSDVAKYQVNDIVKVDRGNDTKMVAPISAVTTTSGNAFITLKFPLASGNFQDSDVVSPFVVFHGAESGFGSLSLSFYEEDASKTYSAGSKVASASMEGFSAGAANANWNFNLEGIGFARSLSTSFDSTETSALASPDYIDALPPQILSATIYKGTTAIAVGEVTINIENTIPRKKATSAATGTVAIRNTKRLVAGTINPYKASDSLTIFNEFNDETSFSIFGYARNLDANGKEINVSAFYMPNCYITNLADGDTDGLMLDDIEFRAAQTSTEKDLYVGLI